MQPKRWEIPPLDHAPYLTSQQVLLLPGGGSARCTSLSVKEGEELLLGSSMLLPLMPPDARQESVMSSSVSTRKRQSVNFGAQRELLDFTWIVFSGSFQVLFWRFVLLSQVHRQTMQLFIPCTYLKPASPHISVLL